MPNKSIIDEELASSIDKARKQVTILFTDIVDSSRYWDQFGDIKGRMMVTGTIDWYFLLLINSMAESLKQLATV